MNQSKDTTDAQRANGISAPFPSVRHPADRVTALQEAADEIGAVASSFDQKSFFDAL